MKDFIAGILDKYRHHPSMSSEEIAEILVNKTNTFHPLDTEAILTKFDIVAPKLAELHEETEKVDKFLARTRVLEHTVIDNHKDHLKLAKKLDKIEEEISERIDVALEPMDNISFEKRFKELQFHVGMLQRTIEIIAQYVPDESMEDMSMEIRDSMDYENSK